MQITKLERDGNDCIINTTLILDEDILIVIDRYCGSWCTDEPNVRIHTEDAEKIYNKMLSKYSK